MAVVAGRLPSGGSPQSIRKVTTFDSLERKLRLQQELFAWARLRCGSPQQRKLYEKGWTSTTPETGRACFKDSGACRLHCFSRRGEYLHHDRHFALSSILIQFAFGRPEKTKNMLRSRNIGPRRDWRGQGPGFQLSNEASRTAAKPGSLYLSARKEFNAGRMRSRGLAKLTA